MCSYGQGSIGAVSGTTLGVIETSKMKENERFYGFTDFRAACGAEGEGETQNTESSYRRWGSQMNANNLPPRNGV